MGIEQQKFTNQDEHEKQLLENQKKWQELERELKPAVVEMVEKRIKEQGISEDEIRRKIIDLKHASKLKNTPEEELMKEPFIDEELTDEDLENLREEAIEAWKEETIDLELAKQVTERLEK